jgi:PKD repeat protein
VLAASVTGGTSMYSYTWSNGVTGTQTSYYPNWCVTITDLMTACDTTFCDTIGVLPCDLAAQVSGNASTGVLVATATSQMPPFTYTWSNGTSGSTTSYYFPWCVTITDALGCDTMICDTSGPCTISNMMVEVGPCDSSGMAFVDIAFSSQDVGASGFQITGNGTNYGTFAYGQSFYTVGPIAADGITQYEFMVQDLDSINCNYTYFLGNFMCAEDSICEAEYSYVDIGVNTVDFTNLSYPATPPGVFAVEYDWDYGDGNVDYSYVGNPSHQYMNSGTYYVCLTSTLYNPNTGDIICTDTYCDSVTVGSSSANCQADFTVNSSMVTNAALIMLFDDQSTPMGSVNTWSWTFGDGGISNSQNPVHTYTVPGNYVVCLTVGVLDPSCLSTICDTVEVDYPSSIVSHASLSAFDLYPNPTNGQVNILLEMTDKAVGEVKVYNVLGSELMNRALLLNAGETIVNLPVEKLAIGTYTVEVQLKTGKSHYRQLMIVK